MEVKELTDLTVPDLIKEYKRSLIDCFNNPQNVGFTYDLISKSEAVLFKE